MMKQILTGLLFFICLNYIGAQSKTDSEIVKRGIRYNSSFEEQLFNNLDSLTFDPLSFLLAIDAYQTRETCEIARNRIEASITEIKLKLKPNKLEKNVNIIYKEIHDRFLKRYSLLAFADELFKDGTYNCVTATALYAIHFKELDIKYAIEELPTHVYIVADPQGVKIEIETTDPKAGYYVPSDREKKAFVEYMKENKLISEQELKFKSVDHIFSEYYYNNDRISIRELTGLQYHNSGIQFLSEEKHEEALSQFKKAYLLYPSSPTIEFMITSSAAKLLKEADFSKIDNISLLVDTYQFALAPESIVREVQRDFARLTDMYLIQNNDTAYYKDIYSVFTTTLKDSTVKSEVDYIYNHEMGRALLLKQQEKKAWPYLATALKHSPNNLELLSMIDHVLLKQLREERDPKNALTRLDAFMEEYPFLENTPSLSKAYMTTYLMVSYNLFNINETKEAVEYLEKFEKLYEETGERLEPSIVARVYGAAWRAYTRKKDNPRAKVYLKKGLGFAPYDEDLRRYDTY